ncbi:sigma-70 family RNA polymerase sigma factor [Paraburkholderia acidisoli]|uniref:Sigma-70 family RNA polymerase sigma factor n=1 Tax=Paraburkholderia acidisoli TaxID=2571748 RepID=A0A7Z2GMK5_9BURK|nr:sigma-70 family RNA polymerase sigma factor [Paraburkholderia acidisoli]QGZ64572.1 sigma-70 family RNA polymerase sigma factor [Paraburkholderia acidisoli]
MSDSGSDSVHSLYANHHAWLHGWLKRKLGCSFEAADLAHDTYVRLIASRRFPQPDESRAWLMQIAKGLVVDLYRHRQIEAAFRDSLALMPEDRWPSTEQQAIAIETLVEIDAVLASLPARVREAFLLSRFDGLTYSEIAVRLKVSVASVRKYMLRAALACFATLAA